MALFKIFKGNKNNLPSTYTDGYAYFTYNDGKFYIDYQDIEDVTNGKPVKRRPLNAYAADTLTVAPKIQYVVKNDDPEKAAYIQITIGNSDDKSSYAIDPVVAMAELPYASGSSSGVLSLVAQEIYGAKTFKDASPIFEKGITLGSNEAIKNRDGLSIISLTESTDKHNRELRLYTSAKNNLYHNDKVILTEANFTDYTDDTYVNVTGDKMSGSLNINGAGDLYVRVNNNTHGWQMRANATSRGIYDDSAKTFIIYQNASDTTNTLQIGGVPVKILTALTASGTATFGGATTFTGTVALNNNATLNSDKYLYFGSTTYYISGTGAAKLNTLDVVNGVSLESTLTVAGDVTASSHIAATGNITSAATISAPYITANTTLKSNGTAIISSKHTTQALTVTGGATFGETVVAKKAEIGASGATITGTTTAQHVNPSEHNTYDLGTNTVRWKNIYAQDTVYATTFNGNATSASKFNSARTIKLSGDVSGEVSSTGESGWSITTTIGASKVTNNMLAGSIANGKLANSSIGIAGTTVSLGGSIDANTLRTNLGLTNAMHYIGISKNKITNQSDTNPGIYGEDGSQTAFEQNRQAGDVVIYGTKEYVWNSVNARWELLGDEGSYKILQDAVSSPDASGNTSAFIDTISQDTNGKIAVTKKNVQITVTASGAGDGVVNLTHSNGTNGVTYNATHTEKGPSGGYTSGNSVQTLTGEEISFSIPQITVDTYGHTTAAADESISLLLPASGTWFNNGFTTVNGSGITEIGRYLDFHGTGASTNNYDIRIDAGTGAKQNVLYLPDINGQFVVHTNNTAIGSEVIPIYIAASGAATASTSTVGSGIKPIWLNKGTLTASSSTVGSGSKPIYLNSGELTVSAANVGGSNKPIYMNAGELTASTSNIGGNAKPIYMSSGTITASTASVGSGVKPIFISEGTLTASSSTVGAGNTPIYLNEGTLTASTSTIGANNKPIYLNNGVLTAFSSAIGGTSKPVYINSSGVITACSGRTVPGIKSASSLAHLGWGTNNNYVPDISCLAYWSGAYDSSNNSNLTYCAKGAFGSIVTKNTGDYLPISGGTLSSNTAQIQRAGSSVQWIKGRTNAMIRINSYSGYNAIYSMKTTNGDWSCGVYSDNTLYWTYCTDTNYDANNNATTTQMKITPAGTLTATKVYGAVWNDYAEFRESDEQIEPGRVVIENGDDTLSLSRDRLQPGPNVVSDTYGFAIGETSKAKTPIAVSGRVLAYPYESIDTFSAGDPVCSGPNGTVSKMTREEVMMYPDRIVGTVSSIPTYKTWSTDNINVNGRIWIKIK